MFIVKLQGGLGNQLFQYAFVRAESVRWGEDFKIDVSFYAGQDLREYKLGYYRIIENLASPIETLVAKLLGKMGLNKGKYLEGYWQGEKYFKEVADDIRREFTLKGPLSQEAQVLAEKIRMVPNAVSLHIRRGDYVSNEKVKNILGPLPLDYYEQAIGIMKERIGDLHIFIFSDDPGWVKDNLNVDLPVTYLSGGGLKDYEELNLMSLCKHNIIANSSFSWWGAWLNANPDKIVIAPKHWSLDGSIKTEELIPEKWIQV